jgi:tetratricopeptide (TPR) repeat protein
MTGRLALRGVAAGVCVVLALAVAPAASAQPAPATERLFVAPFEVNGPTQRSYWMGEGVAILLADELRAAGADAVGRSGRAAALEALGLPDASPLTRATLIRVAESVQATGLVVGRIEITEASLTVGARLVRLAAGTYEPELVEQGAPGELFALARRLAGRVLATARGRPAPAPAPSSAVAASGWPALDTFEWYVKALLDERPEARVRLLKAALAKEPSFDRAWLALWDAHARAGDYQAALAAAHAVAGTSARSREARFLAARSLMDLKRFDEAFDVLTALAAELPWASVYNNIGVVQLRRGATPETGLAVYYFTKASEADPEDPDIYFNLGYAYWAGRDAPSAVYWLREAVRRNPLDADAHFVLAAALAAAGAIAEAGRERELAGRLAARYEDLARQGQAADQAPRGLERVRDALAPVRTVTFDAAITSAARRDARDLTAFYLDRGRRALDELRDGEAVTELRKALYLSPYEAEGHLLLGRAYLVGGRPEEAITALRMSLWSREDARARLALAEALLADGQRDAARAEAQRALQLDPASEAARALLATLTP